MTLPLIFLFAAVALLTGFMLALVVRADRMRRKHQARLQRGTIRRAADASTAVAPKRTAGSKGGLFARIEAQLVQTSLHTTPTELVMQVSIGVMALYALAILLLGLHPLLAIPLALIVPLAVAVLVICVAKARYLAAFTEGLPEALHVFARGLRAGRPIADSLGIVVDTANGPVQQEFERCHGEICMGTALSTSLARLDARLASPEVSFFAVATALQSETGGNLIETLENLAEQLRERRKLRKKARALSSEARTSAVILASLPFAVALVLALLNGSYLAPLYSDPRGQVMAAIAITGVGLGVFMMARMGKLDV